MNFTENVAVSLASFVIACPSGSGGQRFAVFGSGTSTIRLDPTADLPAGVVCEVKVVAAQIADADTADPPDQMATNHVFTFTIPPQAVDDARSATGNIRIDTAGSGFSVLTNDVGIGLTVLTADTRQRRRRGSQRGWHGSIHVQPAGRLRRPGQLQLHDHQPAGTDVGTVNLTVSGMEWFISNFVGHSA